MRPMASTSPRPNSEDHPGCTHSSWNNTAHLLTGGFVVEMVEGTWVALGIDRLSFSCSIKDVQTNLVCGKEKHISTE